MRLCNCRNTCNVINHAIKFAVCGIPSDFSHMGQNHTADPLQSLEHVLFLRVESMLLANQGRGEQG